MLNNCIDAKNANYRNRECMLSETFKHILKHIHIQYSSYIEIFISMVRIHLSPIRLYETVRNALYRSHLRRAIGKFPKFNKRSTLHLEMKQKEKKINPLFYLSHHKRTRSLVPSALSIVVHSRPTSRSLHSIPVRGPIITAQSRVTLRSRPRLIETRTFITSPSVRDTAQPVNIYTRNIKRRGVYNLAP